MKTDGKYLKSIVLTFIVMILLCALLQIQNSSLFFNQFDSSQDVTFFKKNTINKQVKQGQQQTEIIFKGNFISMYELPIAQETVKLVMYEDNQNPIKSIKTGDNGQFELTQVIQQKDFIEFNSQTISVGLYINISNQLIRTFYFQLTQDFLHSSQITFDFTNKILEQKSKIKSLINGSVIDKTTLSSIKGAQVQASYFYPMSIAKMELLTNKVGYFEFNLELDYFEVIIVDLIITNEGYKTYKASEDPQFAKDKGIALFDKYSFTFFNSIKLEKL
ncbi:transmembrane protein, putative (macronuclear) [Tetrahymena thermophila SB210]|uniref:Transmembrane protein, putative n=1 Tax=Tetrahymena thermophila (strain SB210) TaxID=312017 RepID=Q22CY6_TETTS|nr:transmembrane protein, putative [Tetrahymena thermophila SB210]EAR83133.3 transmembrane protein, putative [Tetrahymena thermophila SB210]|eukprot:XP_001030796.3 transmembrane protein, putative [Tetrahymena thermophila SB210]